MSDSLSGGGCISGCPKSGESGGVLHSTGGGEGDGGRKLASTMSDVSDGVRSSGDGGEGGGICWCSRCMSRQRVNESRDSCSLSGGLSSGEEEGGGMSRGDERTESGGSPMSGDGVCGVWGGGIF